MKNEKSNHVVFRTVNRGDGSKGVQADTPEKVLPIYDKEELLAQLRHYAKLLLSLHTANSVAAKRRYVELVRPTLRYYCKKFSVDVPEWLRTDDFYKSMPMADKQKHFGAKPLRIGEFQTLQSVQGVEGVTYPGQSEEEANADQP